MRIKAPSTVTLNNLLCQVMRFQNLSKIICHHKLSGKFSDCMTRNYYKTISGKISASTRHDLLAYQFHSIMCDHHPNQYHLKDDGYYFNADDLVSLIEMAEDKNESLSDLSDYF